MNACLRFLLASLAVLTAGIAGAQPVGRVLLAAGDTVAVRNGQTIRLQYNSPIEFRDVLRTGPASSLQVRFVDEGLISLRDNSEFAIEDYRFAGAAPAEEERAFFRLIKGGFRSVTGLIGRTRNQNYRVQTQTATIGIRGTDYGVRLCAGDCGSGVKDGLYGTVHGQSSGTNQITVTNEGTPTPQTFGINQHFYVQDSKSAPQPLLQPPSFVSIRPQGKAQAAQQGGQGSGGEQSSSNSGAQAESRPNSPTEAGTTSIPTLPVTQYQVTENLNTAGTPAVLNPANGFGVFYPFAGGFEGSFDDKDGSATYNGQNQLTSYRFTTIAASGSLTGQIVDAGGITLPTGQNFQWGRWTGGTVTTSSGTVLTNVPLLFITGSDVQNGPEAKFIGGQGVYSFRGGPSAVDFGGNTGTVTSANLSINFTTQSVSYSLGLNFASIGTFGPAIFSVSGSGGPTSGSHSGEFSGSLSGTCSGGGCQSSSAFGQFDVGLAGPNGYDFAVVGGGLTNATKAGSVVFLTAHEVSSFTPGPAPTFLSGQMSWANASPSAANVFSLGTSQTTYSGGFPVAFSCCGTSASFTGSPIETGSVALVDGTTMTWGRWATANSFVNQTSPSPASYSPSTGALFVLGSANASIPTSGSFTYTFAGGPNPTNTSGTTGTWGGGAFAVTFGSTSGAISVATPLTFSISGLNYSLSSCSSGCTFPNSSAVAGNMVLNGLCSGGSCSTGQTATGNLAGFFVGSSTAPAPGGLAVAGNVFSSSPFAAPVVSIAGAFKR